ncbi:MAG: 3-phosphoshikimate 1-carboxyvinyltransferase [Chloroflexota bacterium]|nr:3-phosphoshikimate 1-carboxyvinyltransferase [Chloroflexota bacterium]
MPPVAARPIASVRPAASLRGSVRVPADKSIAHRALILGALASGTATIEIRRPGDDVRSTMGALAALGVSLAVAPADADDAVRVDVTGLGDDRALGRLVDGAVDCGNSGTTMRLLAGAFAHGAGRSMLTGDASLSRRPMERVADPLRAMGARVETTDGHAPLVISGRRPLRAIEHEVPVASAQVLGALAIAALAGDGRTTIRVGRPTRDHTERLLSRLGASVERQALPGGGTVTTVDGPAVLRARPLAVPGDFSSAAAWIVAASIHPDADLVLPGVGLNPTRTALLDVLREMGADITVVAHPEDPEPAGDVIVRSAGRLRAVSVGADRVPALIDELPLLAVAMAAADGVSEVRGAGELRVKESDRIVTMADALAAAGADVEELPDGWRIAAGRPADALIATGADHRIAIALAVAGWSGLARSVVLDDAACVAVSYPRFWDDAASVGATA